MVCSVQDLREREIINLKDGARLGSVCDVEIDTLSGSIVNFDCPEELMPQKPKNPIDTLFRL